MENSVALERRKYYRYATLQREIVMSASMRSLAALKMRVVGLQDKESWRLDEDVGVTGLASFVITSPQKRLRGF